MFFFMLVYLFLVIIRPQDYPAMAGGNWPYQPAALIVAAILWLFSKRKSFDAPQYPLLLMFFVILMLSQVVNGWVGGAVYVATVFIPVGMAFTLLAHACNSRERIMQVMAMLAICAGVLALHGVEQEQTGMGWTGIALSQETRIQYVGIFNDPNDLGLLFVMCLPMAGYLSSRGGLMGLRRLFWLAVAGLLVYGIYLTNSRGTILALLVVLGVYVWRKRGLITAGVLGAGALGGLMMLPSRLQDVDVSEESAFGRVDSWYEGMQMFMSNPLFGVGPGNYTDYNTLTAHNSFMLVLAEAGYFGFTIWLAFVGYCFWMMVVVIRGNDMAIEYQDELDHGGGDGDGGHDGEHAQELMDQWHRDQGIAFTLLLSLCGFFASAFFLSRSYVITLYLLAAIVVGHYSSMQGTYPWLPKFKLGKDVLRWPLISLVAVVLLFVVVKILLAAS